MARHASRWQPMTQGEPNPAYMARVYPDGLPEGHHTLRVFGNDIYQATVLDRDDGWSYISFKRHDRSAIRDWRHFQAIKNECCGAEREAVELFPAESRLIDESNQYHLWVAPAGVVLPFGDHKTGRSIVTPEELEAMPDKGKARQRGWQEGLPTGANVKVPA